MIFIILVVVILVLMSSRASNVLGANVGIKPGVRVQGLSSAMVLAANLLAGLFNRLGFEFVITSGVEGIHARASLHFSGNAIDIRSNVIPSARRAEVLGLMKSELGAPDSDYDVILEIDHYHVEFQPKKPF